MIRLIALFLLLTNALYFVWGNGFLRDFGVAPQQQSEPQRLAQQINPKAVHALSLQEVRQAEVAARAELAARECLQAGPLDEPHKITLTALLVTALPAGAWQWETQPLGARWIVYKGPYRQPDALQKKRSELTELDVPSEVLISPPLGPGLSLGVFDTQAAAEAGLVRLNARGVRTARVAQERAAGQVYWLKLSTHDDAVKTRISEIRTALGAQPLQACN